MKWLHGKRIFGAGMLKEKPVRRLMEETAAYLSKGIERGVVQESLSEAMASSLRESAGVFSGFKTFHEMKEAANLLLDENGDLKPFERFSNDVQKINDAYNKHYLKTEYNFALQSAEMAARWEEQQDDGDGRYLLQYRTAGDKKVRPAHQELNGITLPPSDPFWDKYYPPNGFNCRCTVQKVRAAKYPATDSNEAMKAGDKATEGKYAEMFRFNPANSGRLTRLTILTRSRSAPPVKRTGWNWQRFQATNFAPPARSFGNAPGTSANRRRPSNGSTTFGKCSRF